MFFGSDIQGYKNPQWFSSENPRFHLPGSFPLFQACRKDPREIVPIFTCQNKTFKNQGLYLWRLECLWILSRCCCWISFDLYHLQNVRRWTLAKKLVRDASNMQGNLERFSWFLDLEIECVGDCWSLFKVNRGILKGSALKDGDEAKLDTLHRSLNLKSFFISAVIIPTGGHWLLRLFDVSHQECFALVFAPMVIIMWHRRLIVILWEPCKIESTKWLSYGYCILRPCFLVGFFGGEWGGDPLCKGQAGMYHWIAGKIKQAPKFHVIWKWLKGLSIKKLAILVQSHICHIHACDRMWYSPIFVVRSVFYSWSPMTCDVFVPAKHRRFFHAVC